MLTRKYIALACPPQGWTTNHVEFWAERPTMTVFENSDAPVDTGLVDASGARLYRVDERQPIGFCSRNR